MTGREASVAARIKAVAMEKGITFQYATLLYMNEGLLRRLSGSPFRDRFVLKGGLLLQSLAESGGRTTKDIDLLGNGIENDVENLRAVFSSIGKIEDEDALRFDDISMNVEAIMEGADYHGIRLRVPCFLGNIRNTIQIDVGFGDAVEPPPRHMRYPLLIGGREFFILSYPLAAVVAEKFETIIALADSSSRMKDFWDLAFILEHFEIPEEELHAALRATFERRHTPRPAEPLVFSHAFVSSERALGLWSAFMKRTHLPVQAWENALEIIKGRLAPLYKEIRNALQ